MRKLILAGLAASLITACVPEEKDGNTVIKQGGDSMTTELVEAANQQDTKRVKELIEQNTELNTQDSEGRTALMIATYNNDAPTVKALLDAGADVDIQDNMQNNCFLYAGAEGYIDIMRFANEAGADVTLTNRYGGVAVIPAAERGHVEMVEALLNETKVDVNHVNDLGWTALMEAVVLSDGGVQHQEIIKILLKHGADQSITDKDGITPLQHAKDKGYLEIVDILEAASL
ncbi:ankyrin repeat domain-containing protein [Sporosarcina aquimarina]|uniref:Ankyrin repeat domain-containing protein n=1 Tax=Sporosarcina aquimarina TaxID=114975 RepID=A0ABU4G1N9_9BACL|nr:ankyrin repeat domain-containing protein [Sporosarcina aquimarina]MDW0110884.1 ankyrin repeat domain-containing protein [Sporosarcina aquimarina]